MKSIPRLLSLLPVLGLMFVAVDAQAQKFRVQCPTNTTFHADGSGIKCQQIAGGDGYATMGDGHTIYMFGFGPLSGLPDIYHGLPGTQVNSLFNTTLGADGSSGDAGNPNTSTSNTLIGMPDGSFTFQGAIGLTYDFGLDPWVAATQYAVGTTVRTATSIYTATVGGTSSLGTA